MFARNTFVFCTLRYHDMQLKYSYWDKDFCDASLYHMVAGLKTKTFLQSGLLLKEREIVWRQKCISMFTGKNFKTSQVIIIHEMHKHFMQFAIYHILNKITLICKILYKTSLWITDYGTWNTSNQFECDGDLCTAHS